MSSEKTTKLVTPSCHSSKSDLSAIGWQNRYDNGMTGWDRGETNPMLTRWLDSEELKPCRIVVPGCGRGYEVITLAAAGFEVTAVDFAPTAVKHLRSELDRLGLHADVVQSDIFAFDMGNRFDAVYEQTCLCALDPSQWKTYEQLLARWLKPGGRLFALFMQSDRQDGPPFACKLPEMQALFDQTTWRWMSDPIEVPHPSGPHEMGCVLSRKETDQ